MQRSSVRELADAARSHYLRATKTRRSRILEEFCAVTGYHRTYAAALLRGGSARHLGARRPGRPRQYGPLEVGLLRACWEITDGICGKRLAPFLSELLAQLRSCDALPEEATVAVVERVAKMSAASVDRLIGPYRATWPRRGWGTTKPGTLLKHQIPIRTYAEWDDVRPGFLEIDLVAHCGYSGLGEFLFTLSTVDIATGWSACVGVRNKGEYATFEALCALRHQLPFPLLGIDSDNGGEFINRSFVRYCDREGITFTRSRPYRKNDSCHVEQKNWSVVRRLVGYGRFELNALVPLNEVHQVARDFVNFFQPVQKLVHRQRDGGRVTRRHDRAKTPYQRLVAAGLLTPERSAALASHYAALNPLQLKLDLEEAQKKLYARAATDTPRRVPAAYQPESIGPGLRKG